MNRNTLGRLPQDETRRKGECFWIMLDDFPDRRSMDDLRFLDVVGKHLVYGMP
jgi:hypothetical protein